MSAIDHDDAVMMPFAEVQAMAAEYLEWSLGGWSSLPSEVPVTLVQEIAQ